MQLELDLGIEKIVKADVPERKGSIVYCCRCNLEKELYEVLPVKYDGVDIYSNVLGYFCKDCYYASSGDEISRLYNTRMIIRDQKYNYYIKEVLPTIYKGEKRKLLLEIIKINNQYKR